MTNKRNMYQITTINFVDKQFNQHLMFKDGIQFIIQPDMFLNKEEVDELIEKGKLIWKDYGVILKELNEVDECLLYEYFNQPSELDIQESEQNYQA